MAPTTKAMAILFCLPSLGLARRKMAGSAKNADAVDVQQKWDYTTAKTAWDVLCHNRDAGVFAAKWKESDCKLFCNDLKFKCDPDERVENIEITWKRFTKATMSIPKTATPVTNDDGTSFRFFVESEGCDGGEGANDKDCELPWGAFDTIRQHTEVVDITRRFLVYDASKPGDRAVSIETNKYEATFFRSDVDILGTGAPLPAAPVYAGATGTGCGKGLTQCSLPVQGPEPVGETLELDVTTDFLVEDTPGFVSLMKNRNVAKTKTTQVTEFEWGN